MLMRTVLDIGPLRKDGKLLGANTGQGPGGKIVNGYGWTVLQCSGGTG